MVEGGWPVKALVDCCSRGFVEFKVCLSLILLD